MGELAHLHSVFDGWARAPHARPLQAAGDGYYVKVDLGCQAPVKPNLLLAEEVALLKDAEVQEAQVKGLLYLVRIGAREDDPGDVGLHQAEVVHRVVESVRREQGLDVDLLRVLLDELPVKMAVKIAMRLTGKKKNEIYRQALEIRDGAAMEPEA